MINREDILLIYFKERIRRNSCLPIPIGNKNLLVDKKEKVFFTIDDGEELISRL